MMSSYGHIWWIKETARRKYISAESDFRSALNHPYKTKQDIEWAARDFLNAVREAEPQNIPINNALVHQANELLSKGN